jgi:hypothetical protein
MAMSKGNRLRAELACSSTPLNDSHILYPTSSLRVFEVSKRLQSAIVQHEAM